MSDREADAWLDRRTEFICNIPHSVLASRREGRIVAAIRFQNWSDNDIELTVAGNEFSRAFLRSAWRYVVRQLGCSRATFRTKATNLAAIHAMGRLGAQMEGVQRRWYPDGSDAVLFGVLSEEFPYGQ